MKSTPILFKPEMVKAILEGRKTQTRRLAKKRKVVARPEFNEKLIEFWEDKGMSNEEAKAATFATIKKHQSMGIPLFKNYCNAGDQLWVKETFQFVTDPFLITENVMYKADGETKKLPDGTFKDGLQVYNWESKNIKWRPSLFMPRIASRITLEITSVRCERLNDISEADAIAEGIEGKYFPNIGVGTMFYKDYFTGEFGLIPTASYRTLWESINGVGSWDLNPFVWVIEFKNQMEND